VDTDPRTFAVIRETIREMGKVANRHGVVLTNREHIIALEAAGEGAWIEVCCQRLFAEMSQKLTAHDTHMALSLRKIRRPVKIIIEDGSDHYRYRACKSSIKVWLLSACKDQHEK
jgi:hypothetical protein